MIVDNTTYATTGAASTDMLGLAANQFVQDITETDYRTSQWAEVPNPSGLPA